MTQGTSKDPARVEQIEREKAAARPAPDDEGNEFCDNCESAHQTGTHVRRPTSPAPESCGCNTFVGSHQLDANACRYPATVAALRIAQEAIAEIADDKYKRRDVRALARAALERIRDREESEVKP